MGAAFDEKQILVLSDNDKLAKAMKLNLQPHWPVSQLVLQPSSPATCLADRFSLIILALSSPASEPVVILTKAGFVQYIGLIPLLVISDRPFSPSPDTRITHLDFPFSAEMLFSKVQAILHGNPHHATTGL